MIEMMMTAMMAVIGLQLAGVFKGRKITKFKTPEHELPVAVVPPKGEMKGGIVFLPPVWEEESLEEMEARVITTLQKEGEKVWPKRASPRWVYMPKLKPVPAPVMLTKEVPKPVWLPELT